MADRPSSFFVPQNLLDMVSAQEAQQASDAAQRTFLFGLLSGDIGAAYNNAQRAGVGSITTAQQISQQRAAAAEAERKRQLEAGRLQAVNENLRMAPGTGVGSASFVDPNVELGPGGVGPGFVRPRYELNEEGLLGDRRYLAAVADDEKALKRIDELRQARLARERSERLATKYKREDGSFDYAGMAQDKEYVASLGFDPSKIKTADELVAAVAKRGQLDAANKSTPFGGAPGMPSAGVQAQATKDAYTARINALNNAGLFEEAGKLTQQLNTLFPEEKFSQTPQFVQDGKGNRKAIVLGDRGTVRPLDNVQEAVSANTIAQLNKPELRETDGGLVRVNPMTGKTTPVIGADGKQIKGKSQILETDTGVYAISGGVATPVMAGGQQLPGKMGNVTEDERKAYGFVQRMTEAEKGMQAPLLDKDGKPILNKKTGKPVTLEQAYGMPEIAGEVARTVLPDWMGAQGLGNILDSKQRQQYRQFQENWVRANLRAESGAAIGKDEMEKEIKTYFPQIGDSSDVIKQKAEARTVTQQSMYSRAGRAVRASQQPAVPLPPGGAAPMPAIGVPSSVVRLPQPAANPNQDFYSRYGLTPPGRN